MTKTKHIFFNSLIAIMAMFTALPAMAATSVQDRASDFLKQYNIDAKSMVDALPGSATVPSQISSKIVDENGEPAIGATVTVIAPTQKVISADENGEFTITTPANATSVKISYVGMAEQTFPINNVPATITLKESAAELGEVIVTAGKCNDNDLKKLHATKGIVSNTTKKCIPTECIEPRYTLSNVDKDNDGNTISGECIDTQGTPCDSMPENVKIAHKENGKCVIKKCNEPEYKLINNKCEYQVGQSCVDKIKNAVTATYQVDGNKLVCRVDKCDEPRYVPNDKKTKCDESDGPCTDAQLKAASHATSGSLRKGKCVITACEKGYHPSKDGDTCDQAELSEQGSQDRINDLKDNAQAMKDKEQSTANKTLGAAAIGATGYGAAQLMEGMAEQKADAAAEEDMKAYLATFACDYGQGRNIRGGQTNIEVPGGNELLASVTEYRTLAADLKARKEALGKQPGIESEVIFDTSETGLYDNVGMGRQSGAYASLSRALTDETSKDAAEWAAQKEATASKVKTGAIVAGAGVVGGLIGNLAINSGKDKQNKVDEILNSNKYQKFSKVIENINKTPIKQNPVECPSGTTGSHPDCICASGPYNPETNACESCQGDLIWYKNEQKCDCPSGQTHTDDTTCATPTKPIVCNPANNVKLNSAETDCECVNSSFKESSSDSTTRTLNKCDCPYDSPDIVNGVCTKKKEEIKKLPISGSSLFELGKSNLGKDGQENVKKIFCALNKTKAQTCTIKVHGYADPIGKEPDNKTLSQKRAQAFADALHAMSDKYENTPGFRKDVRYDINTIQGHGSDDCTCGVAKEMGITPLPAGEDYDVCRNQSDNTRVTTGQRFAPCRRIVIETDCSLEIDDTRPTLDICKDVDSIISDTDTKADDILGLITPTGAASGDGSAIATLTGTAQDTCNPNARWNKLTCIYNSGQGGACPYRYGAGIHQPETRNSEPYKTAFANLDSLCKQTGGTILIAEQTLSAHKNVCGNNNNKYDEIYCVYNQKNTCKDIQNNVRGTIAADLIVETNSAANYAYNGTTYASACQFLSPYKR